MKKIYIGIISILSLAFLSSCSDFLDVESQEKVEAGDSEEVYTPEMFINGIYGMFTDWDYAFSYLAITEIISDNAEKGSSPGDPGGDKELFDNLTFTSTAGSLEAMWKRWYKTIGRAEQAIEYTESYGLTNDTYKNRLIGEAKFLRALCYFYLVRGWGDIPVQNEDLTMRAPKEDIYALIEQDLQDAINVLPEKSEYDSRDLGRATKGAAQALLAKVFLYQSKWQQAYDYATTVIGSGQYDLESDYALIWRASADNGVESIFEIQGRGESIAHGVQQYCQTQGARGDTGWGWGFNTPSENLLNAFNAEGDEIRRDATIIFRNSTLWDGRVVGATENAMYNYKAYSSANAGSDDTDKNIRILRLGEIYLIQAEAANELGNTGQALSALNKVRNRVKLANVTINDQAQLRQKIWDERRLELAFEHDRWADLIRTGQGEDAMKKAGKNFVKGKHDLFPIPNKQILEFPTITQNPQW
ncbi:MAG: RagB/SusD family nutrient uptake outer membrane protein [Dysgonomonas sp.]|nr:RagB/SusD family nutrient uptake outer membrane protein [Dysgonomonas sp.]